MPYVEKIIDFVNTQLQANTLTNKAFQRGRFYGLAKQVFGGDDGNKNQPIIYSIEGNEISPTINDNYPFQIYHRVTDIKYAHADSNVGDGTEEYDVTYQVKAIIYADKTFLKMNDYDLSFLCITGLCMNIEKTDIGALPVGKIVITPAASDMDSRAVFQSEYGKDFEMKTELHDMFFSVTYNINMNVNKNCLSCSDC